MTKEASFKIKVSDFRKLEDPVDPKDGRVKYLCYAQAISLSSDLQDWMATNPREQKMTTGVARSILESLEKNANFHELNRGILFSAKDISYDNKNKEITLVMDDPQKHGNIDGGHTLRAILDKKNSQELSCERYVFLEVFTELDSPVELAEARNTSVQVDLKSIEELKKSFDIIKDVYKDLPFFNRLQYMQNEHYNDKDIKPIDIREIIAITIMFSQTIYNYKKSDGSLSDTQPVQCYSGKEASLRKFIGLSEIKRENMIKNMEPVIKDIFNLWDHVEKDFPLKVNASGKFRYGTRKYSKFDNYNPVGNAFFSEDELHYIVPKGIMYPLIGAFRALIKVDATSGKYSWVINPFDVWEALAEKLTSIIMSEKGDNPEILAKNSNLWSNLFKEVYIYALTMAPVK